MEASAMGYLDRISAKGIPTCLFVTSADAIAHSKKNGLITALPSAD